jgi:hypothetical protein
VCLCVFFKIIYIYFLSDDFDRVVHSLIDELKSMYSWKLLRGQCWFFSLRGSIYSLHLLVSTSTGDVERALKFELIFPYILASNMYKQELLM